MKLQNLTIIFIIIILPIIIVLSSYIGYEIQTINRQNMYNSGLVQATHDAIFSFEINTKNDDYSNNAENKRSNIKAAVKTFENSFSNTCNLGLYNNQQIEEYIPAMAFCLYDGFYMYSPSQTQSEGYKHNLRNYVYYSESIKNSNMDIVIIYTLDNYVAISGKIGRKYVTKAGYLINLNDLSSYSGEKIPETATEINNKDISIMKETTKEYVGKEEKIKENNDLAIRYYKQAYEFTYWFLNTAKIGETKEYLQIGEENDPENETSAFSQHKKAIIKQKIEETLNSSITAYSKKTGNNYKMPKFSDEDWEKIYNNISVISFVQGMNIGFKNYNNYCVLNSTNNQEYVNPNLIYFSDNNNYHDIRCENIADVKTTGYRIGSFEKMQYETTNEEGETTSNYYYKHNELACYNCINGALKNTDDIYDYVCNKASDNVKISYFSALARERQSTVKLLNNYNLENREEPEEPEEPEPPPIIEEPETPIIPNTYKIIANIDGNKRTLDEVEENSDYKISLSSPSKSGYIFNGWSITGEYSSYDSANREIKGIQSDIEITATWKKEVEVEESKERFKSFSILAISFFDVRTNGNTVTYSIKGWYTPGVATKKCKSIFMYGSGGSITITDPSKSKEIVLVRNQTINIKEGSSADIQIAIYARETDEQGKDITKLGFGDTWGRITRTKSVNTGCTKKPSRTIPTIISPTILVTE